MENTNSTTTTNNTNNKSNTTKKVMQTYLKLENEERNEIFHSDLIYIREKGESQQFLELKFTYYDQSVSDYVESVKVIDSKEEFEELKKYFTQLNWGENNNF